MSIFTFRVDNIDCPLSYMLIINDFDNSESIFADSFAKINNYVHLLKATLTHTFQDQSSVLLNAGSQLFFEESEWEKERTLKVIGEAFLSVNSFQKYLVCLDKETEIVEKN